MKKPYYYPETKETYIRGNIRGVEIKMFTGSISFEGKDCVTRNCFGEITKTEPIPHIVCVGVDYCDECGRKMGNNGR